MHLKKVIDSTPMIVLLLTLAKQCLSDAGESARERQQLPQTSFSVSTSVASYSSSSSLQLPKQHGQSEQGSALATGQLARSGRILDYFNSSQQLLPPPPTRHKSVNLKQLLQPNNQTPSASQPAATSHQRQPSALQRLIAQPAGSNTNEPPRQESRARSLDSNPNDEQQQQPPAQDRLPKKQEQTRRGKCIVPDRSGRRSLREVLKSAKSLLTGGFASIEQRAAPVLGNLFWMGSNVLATLIPLASLMGLGPARLQHGQQAPPEMNLSALLETGGNQTSSSTTHSSTATTTTTRQTTGQSLFSASSSSLGGIQSRVEYVMGWLERSMEHLPNFPRLHPQECVKRSICEAHNEPGRYGAIGLMLRLLFPANNLSSTDGQDNMEYKVINKYRHAAGYGLARRAMMEQASNGTGPALSWTGSAACKEKYEDCLVSLLDVAQNLVDFFMNK